MNIRWSNGGSDQGPYDQSARLLTRKPCALGIVESQRLNQEV